MDPELLSLVAHFESGLNKVTKFARKSSDWTQRNQIKKIIQKRTNKAKKVEKGPKLYKKGPKRDQNSPKFTKWDQYLTKYDSQFNSVNTISKQTCWERHQAVFGVTKW